WGVQLLPQTTARAETPQRSGLFACRDLDLAAHALRGRVQRGGRVHVSDGLELIDRGAGPVEVAGGQCDLHLRGQELAPGEWVSGVVAAARFARRGSRLGLPLRSGEKRQAGLRISAQLVRLPESLSGRRKLTQPETDLPELVEGLTACAHRVRAQLLAGIRGLA